MSAGNGHPDRDDKQREAALLIALRTGLLKKCPRHGVVYDPGQHDYQGACMVAAFLVNGDDPLVASFEGDRVSLTELLKSIGQSYSVCCTACPNPDKTLGRSQTQKTDHRRKANTPEKTAKDERVKAFTALPARAGAVAGTAEAAVAAAVVDMLEAEGAGVCVTSRPNIPAQFLSVMIGNR